MPANYVLDGFYFSLRVNVEVILPNTMIDEILTGDEEVVEAPVEVPAEEEEVTEEVAAPEETGAEAA